MYECLFQSAFVKKSQIINCHCDPGLDPGEAISCVLNEIAEPVPTEGRNLAPRNDIAYVMTLRYRIYEPVY